MLCKDVEERDVFERYLLGELTELERDEFEKHYFECASCFSELQTGLALQAELRGQAFVGARARAARFSGLRRLTPVFAAAAIVLCVGIWWYAARSYRWSRQLSSAPSRANPQTQTESRPPTQAAPSLEELARVEPPPYSAVVLRGGEDVAEESFQRAMQHYSKGDYAKAIPGLRAAAKASPETATFNFYLGACYLLTGQTEPAIASFRKTHSIRDSGYAEQAHFYLAKAYLRKKETSSAEDELQQTIGLHGSLAGEAAKILHQLGN